ncbi:MAG: hypothetical protein H6837_09820 [Planctomycetes bacterium]|nr:hypothetical protein [Planctomycetota bacterium]
MYIGQFLPNGAIIFSPWFPREADNAIFTFETIDNDGSGSLTVDVYHKNTEDPGPGAALSATAAFSAIGSTNYKSGRFVGIKEMVRFATRVRGMGNAVSVPFCPVGVHFERGLFETRGAER